MWRCSCLGGRVLAAPGTQGSFVYGSRKYSALEGYDKSIGQYAPAFLPGGPHSVTEKPSKPGLQGRKVSGMAEETLHA